jgi:hypothetical protein
VASYSPSFGFSQFCAANNGRTSYKGSQNQIRIMQHRGSLRDKNLFFISEDSVILKLDFLKML